MQLVYTISIILYSGLIRLAAPFHTKAALWVNGRRRWRKNLREWRKQHPGELIWMHCASLGEFEQGRPLLEALRKKDSSKKILLTFFSPSGYEIRKDYSGADGVFYLPADTAANARDFLEILQPQSIFFVKYEYWANYFRCARERNIPLYMVSAILRPGQRFFGLFAGFWRAVLKCVDHFFVQDEQTADLLRANGFSNYSIAGDTRFDRVLTIASASKEIDALARFRKDAFVLVAGSSWLEDERLLHSWYMRNAPGWKMILVPHEVEESHIVQLLALFPEAIRWSQLGNEDPGERKIMVIDRIGFLSSVYRYADMAWIGGGFGRGIHNTLEAAVWGIPVIFGPRHTRFAEALGLIDAGAGFGVETREEGVKMLEKLASEDAFRQESGRRAGEFVQKGAGATELILKALEKN